MATPSDDPTFELIENVQEEQCLWDRGDELFEDAKYKKAVWADIASKVGYASGDKARSRWESVRDEYVKKKKAAPSGSAGGKKPAWKYWDQMQFLDGVLEPRPGHSSTLSQDPAVENDDTDELASNTDSSRIPPSPAASTTSVSQKRRRSNLEQVEKKLLEGLEETEKQMKLARMEEDSDGMVFGRSVGKSLEKLDTDQAEWAKMHIQQALVNARFIGPHAQKPQYTQTVPLQQFYGGMQPIHHYAGDVNAEDHLGAEAAFRL